MVTRESLNQLAAPYLIMLGFGLVILVASLDYLTGKEIGLTIFYLFPVAFVTWFVKRWDGVCVSAIAVLAWFVVETMLDDLYSRPNLLYWNMAVRVGFFSIIVAIVSSIKLSFDENSKLILEVQIALAKINTLRALAPICAWCQKIRDSQGHWQQFKTYVAEHPVVDVTHDICPECLNRLEDAV